MVIAFLRLVVHVCVALRVLLHCAWFSHGQGGPIAPIFALLALRSVPEQPPGDVEGVGGDCFFPVGGGCVCDVTCIAALWLVFPWAVRADGANFCAARVAVRIGTSIRRWGRLYWFFPAGGACVCDATCIAALWLVFPWAGRADRAHFCV